MLDYNTLEGAKRREKAKPLSIPEEYKVVELLNERIGEGQHKKITRAQHNLLQRFIDTYQNLRHSAKSKKGK
jgi:hypothetical protein